MNNTVKTFYTDYCIMHDNNSTTMKQELKRIINNIREKREEKKFTQEYMGSSLGISQNAYSKIELHQSKLTLERLLLISELLEIDTATLLGYKNTTKKDLS